MEVVSNIANGFIGLFNAGGETFMGWVTGIIPLVICLMTAVNAVIGFIGVERVEGFCQKITKYTILRYTLLPVMADIFLTNPAQYTFGRFLKKEHKAAFYGIMASVFDSYAPYKGDISRRGTGSMISFETGESVTYGLFNAQERGTLFIGPGVPVYGGMVIGVSPRSEDITVNICKKKQLTNMRASGSDEALRLVPPKQMSLEQCLEFLADDELLEVTPKSLRMRKAILDHEKRMKALHGKK